MLDFYLQILIFHNSAQKILPQIFIPLRSHVTKTTLISSPVPGAGEGQIGPHCVDQTGRGSPPANDHRREEERFLWVHAAELRNPLQKGTGG